MFYGTNSNDFCVAKIYFDPHMLEYPTKAFTSSANEFVDHCMKICAICIFFFILNSFLYRFLLYLFLSYHFQPWKLDIAYFTYILNGKFCSFGIFPRMATVKFAETSTSWAIRRVARDPNFEI